MLPVLLTSAALAGPVPLDLPGLVEVDLSEAITHESAVDERFRVSGPWRLVRTAEGVRTWEAPLPARTRTLFFHRPPPGMTVERRVADSWRKVTHSAGSHARADTWTFDTHSLRVRRAASDGPPPAGDYAMRFARAAERERELRDPGDNPVSFVIRTLQLDDTNRRGLYLIPGARVRVKIDIPKGAVLRFDAVGVPPEGADPAVPRDGQKLLVRALTADGATELASVHASDAHPERVRRSLDAFADQSITLELYAPPDEVNSHDAVMVASPVVFVPSPTPPRIVMVFIDTLRHDAMSLAGNPNATTPGLDAWAEQAAVFTQARSVAPWTLPTARTLFSGHLPELWGQREDLASRLHSNGWATAFIAGNIYLSSNFEMADNWGTHRCINWPQAEVQVDRARAWLDEHSDQPAFLVLHFMDMHLPYTEPAAFRDRFAGPTPLPFTSDVFHRNQILQWERKMDDSSRAWLRGRYDNNLAYIDSVLTPFLGDLSKEATVIVLSDHGEEFWDHGDFEHGHSLYDELLRVPLIARGPGLTPGEHTMPTSLIDVAPTVLRAAGIEPELDGIALQTLSTRPPEGIEERPIAFGRPLYGRRRWGVVQGQHKYTTTKSIEKVVNLADDPDEKKNLVLRGTDPLPWRQALADGLGLPVEVAYAIYPQRSTTRKDTVVQVELAGGIQAAWASEDPTQQSAVSVEPQDTVTMLTWAGGKRGTREAYVVPVGDPIASLDDIRITIGAGEAEDPLPLPTPDRAAPLDGRSHTLGRARADGRSVSVNLSVVPLPPDQSVGITGYDDEVRSELEALGYLEE